MRMRSFSSVLFAFCVVSLVACTKQQSFQEKYAPLYRSARAVDGAIAVGVSYPAFGELLQKFATESLIAGDKAKTEEEKILIKAYMDLLETYKDSATVWKHKIDSAKYDWLRGSIYVEQELGPIVEKYSLPKSYGRSGSSTYTTIPDDSMLRIWNAAGEKREKAMALYFGEGTMPKNK